MKSKLFYTAWRFKTTKLAHHATNSVIISTSVISSERITEVKLINGAKIAELREQKGWGQRELATAAKIDHSVISRLERNLQSDCMVSALSAIAFVLGVSIDELLYEGQQSTYIQLVPKLQAVVNELSRKDANIQRQAAGILTGYLSTLDDGSTN
jgi:transcriptional regulator with XRE-family HTH domain